MYKEQENSYRGWPDHQFLSLSWAQSLTMQSEEPFLGGREAVLSLLPSRPVQNLLSIFPVSVLSDFFLVPEQSPQNH